MIHPVSKALGPRRGVFVTHDNQIKIGTNGKAASPKAALSKVDKGARRRIRKDLHAAGHRAVVLASL